MLDRDEVRRLFDLRSSYHAKTGGDYTGDPYPVWKELRERAPIHEGTLHGLTGYLGEASFHGLPYPDRPHFTAFTFAACDAALRDEEVFASSPDAAGPDADDVGVMGSMLTMAGARHRRYRSLVQPSFVPAKAQWWITNWIEHTVHEVIDSFVADGRAELNVDFGAAIPLLTITGSFGVPIDKALSIRQAVGNPTVVVEILTPIVAARRAEPQDDLISVLVEAEYTDDEGVTHRLSDPEIYAFAVLLLAAGSGTTWKQTGITLATLLQRPELFDAVREDRTLLRSAIEESARWLPTDPMFSRWVTRDIDFHGVHLPQGAVLHLCLGAANRDPARWERPEEFDIRRAPKPTVAFGSGPHVCLGMHVARAEMMTGIGALLDRLPNLRLDPDADAPQIIGLYERGATAIPVLFG
jgi:cytochrome P450